MNTYRFTAGGPTDPTRVMLEERKTARPETAIVSIEASGTRLRIGDRDTARTLLDQLEFALRTYDSYAENMKEVLGEKGVGKEVERV